MEKDNQCTKNLFGLFFVSLFASSSSFAALPPGTAAQLPGYSNPGVVNKYLKPEGPQPSAIQPLPSLPQKKPGLAGTAAQEIKFQLNGIELEGNTIYSTTDLQKIYQNKLHQQISIAELQQITQDITNYYRNNGYILTRAILPPQHVKNGIVKIQILEGYIDQVRVIGKPKKAKKILEAYGNHITESKPLNISVMEYYLRVANEVPGVTAKAVLEPSKTEVGASDLNIVADTQTFQGFISYDNYGTLYEGPNQVTGSGSLNSILASGDSTRVFYVQTTRPKELQYYDISYHIPMGTKGVSFMGGGNASFTRPGLNLAPLKINGYGANYYGTIYYPAVRSRDADLTLDLGFNMLDSQVTTGIPTTEPLYTDHVRSITADMNGSISDKYRGLNYGDFQIEEGLNIFGASNDPTSLTTSRFGGRGVYTKFVTTVSRVQQLFSRFSFYVMMTGQYSTVPLLASEQFTFGGSVMGRGYSPAEIIGDRGFGGTLELRMQTNPGLRFLQAVQPYIFYDGGVIWNIKNVAGVLNKSSITSAGGGMRIALTNNITGNLMVGQPLTKQNAAEEVVGNGRRLQGYFSVTASI